MLLEWWHPELNSVLPSCFDQLGSAVAEKTVGKLMVGLMALLDQTLVECGVKSLSDHTRFASAGTLFNLRHLPGNGLQGRDCRIRIQ